MHKALAAINKIQTKQPRQRRAYPLPAPTDGAAWALWGVVR